MTLLSILGLGFVLGMRHATDSDHVVAVSTILSRERSAWSAARVGALWGAGHTFTIMVVGGAIIVFDLVIPARLGLSMELAVGIMLVVLGGLNLSGALRRIDEVADDEVANKEVANKEVANKEVANKEVANKEVAHTGHTHVRVPVDHLARPLLVGVVHGLAGSAALALLVLTTIRDVRSALLYLAVFSFGTVVGMTLLSSALAAPLAFAATRNERVNHHMARVTGVLSVAFGVVVLYRIGIVDGLFTSHPHWAP